MGCLYKIDHGGIIGVISCSCFIPLILAGTILRSQVEPLVFRLLPTMCMLPNPSSIKQQYGEQMDEFTPEHILRAVIEDRIWIAQHVSHQAISKFQCFSTEQLLFYHPLCDDFGPMNMSSVVKFITTLDEEIKANPNARIAYCVEDGRRALTNAVFLLGAYMIIKQGDTVDEVLKCFQWLDPSCIEAFRDATFSRPNFALSLVDCWSALKKGCALGWIKTPSSPEEIWGEIDVEEYDHYEDPLNGDLHIVVPGKFIAFKGPKDLGSRQYLDDLKGSRLFSPTYYVDIFADMGVSAIVRLNEPEYPADRFLVGGFAHQDLEFEDCTPPPPDVVASFFAFVDSQPGLVAVHCKAGLGRTGTLIALYLMRRHRFTARAAIAWLRIMRPGCVIGEQQQYLCAIEDTIRENLRRRLSAANAASVSASASPVPAGGTRAAHGGNFRDGSGRVSAEDNIAFAVPDASRSRDVCPPTAAGPAPPRRVQPSASFSFGGSRSSRAAAAEVAAGLERRDASRASGGSFVRRASYGAVLP